MHRSGWQDRRLRRQDEWPPPAKGVHRMGWGTQVLSRLGFGTGALATTAVILTGFTITQGDVTFSTLAGDRSSDNQTTTTDAIDVDPTQAPTDNSSADPGGVDDAAPASPGTTSIVAPNTAIPTPTAPTTTPSGARRSASAAHSSGTRNTATPSATPTTSRPAEKDLGKQVLAQINAARTAEGVPSLTMSPGLVRSALAHNEQMATGCGLSHQCSNESDLGKRISAQGIAWTAAGENIGQGGPEPDTGKAIVSMARQLTADMLAETAPNDGHRKNILSKNFKHVGISLYRDANGTVWMTQDFSS